jgi:hypothetical protein
MKKIAIVLFALLLVTSVATATTYYSRASGNWNINTTWSTVSYASSTNTGTYPLAGDIVNIGGDRTVTVTAEAACSTITFATTNTNILSINTGITLTVSADITIPRSNTSEYNRIAVGAGILNADRILFTDAGTSSRHDIVISTGKVTVSGSIVGWGGSGSPTITFTGAGLLQVGGNMFTNAQGTLTTVAGSTVEYNGAGSDSVGDFTYDNLTINGSGYKTLSGLITTVLDTLRLTKGIVRTGSDTLMMYTAATLIGGSSSSFVTTVDTLSGLGGNGAMAWTVAGTGTFTRVFPLGVMMWYRPITLHWTTSNSNSTTYYAQHREAKPFNRLMPGTLNHVHVARYDSLWRDVSPVTITSADITLTYNDHDAVTDASALRIAQWQGTGNTWTNVGGTGTGTPSGTITSTTNFTSFSPFVLASTLGSGTNPLPVELASFTGSMLDNGVELKWSTASELNNYGFDVERKAKNGEGMWEKLGFIEGQGTSNTSHQYEFLDKNVAVGQYAYRLKQIDRDGSFKNYNEIEVTVSAPTEFSLDQNYPNPFNPSTSISFALPEASNVTLRVYNMLGQVVATLLDGGVEAGIHSVPWTPSGLSSGIYIYRLQAKDAGFTQTKTMMLTK